jgi:predicted RNase H-like HicB family nuclease
MKTRSFTVVLHKEENMYIAECPEVGTVDRGETIEQAIAGLKEATQLYLEEFPLPETSPRLVTRMVLGYDDRQLMLFDRLIGYGVICYNFYLYSSIF